MQTEWNRSPPRSENGHSTKEIEHRFTALEAFTKESSSDRAGLHEIVEKHADKLTLHERVLLGILMAIATLLQDKFPVLVHMLKALIGS
ncbi:MAG: hypothetical protein BVN33_14695 [Proteobacteria bacterium ST_bin13]|nr:MAG: hypothetical protein BVN33_14695 [Proteobacteria bacterium ST_bin13]